MSTLYIDRKDIELRYSGGVIEVHEPGGRRGSIPLAGLERVILHGPVKLSTSVIGALVKGGASVGLVGGRRSRYLATCVGGLHNDVQRRLGQFDAFRCEATRQQWAQEIVRAKLAAQLRLLRKALAARPDQRHALFRGSRRIEDALERLTSATQPFALPTLLGIEGAAAAAYFAAYASLFPPSLGFRARRHRPPPDPVNACLSFAYTLLHYEAVSVAYEVGLDPLLGLYHEPSFGRASFAADAIEPFRPHVDAWVWDLFRKRVFTDRGFRAEGRAVLLGKQARARFYQHFNPLCDALRRLLRRQVQGAAREFQRRGKALRAA